MHLPASQNLIEGNRPECYGSCLCGNRWSQTVTKGSGPSNSLTFNAATNRISTSGYSYFPNGNLVPPIPFASTDDQVTNFVHASLKGHLHKAEQTQSDESNREQTEKLLGITIRIEPPQGGEYQKAHESQYNYQT